MSGQQQDVSWFSTYVANLVGHTLGGEEGTDAYRAYNHIISYLAHMVQRPEEKVNHGIIITSSGQGTGKSTLGVIAKALVGPRSSTDISSANLKSHFNSWLAGKIVIVVDELYEGKNADLVHIIKPLITKERLAIEAKGKDIIEAGNYSRFFMFSNSKMPLRIESEDRRFYVYDSSHVPKQSGEYWKSIYRKVNDAEAMAHLYHWLKELDYKRHGFDPKAPPPETAAKRDLIEESKDDLYHFLKAALEDGSLAEEFGASKGMSANDLMTFVRAAGYKPGRTQDFSRILHQVGMTQERIGNNRLWVLPAGTMAGSPKAVEEDTDF